MNAFNDEHSLTRQSRNPAPPFDPVDLALLRDVLDAVEPQLAALPTPLGSLFAHELADVLDAAGVR